MLNSIPIFYLSLLKVPVKVLKMIVRILRKFIWGEGGTLFGEVEEDVPSKK